MTIRDCPAVWRALEGLRSWLALLLVLGYFVLGVGAAHAQAPQTAPVSASESASTPATGRSGAPAAVPLSSAGALLDLTLGLPPSARKSTETSSALRVVVGLTLLAVLPTLLVCMTAFTRIVIVLSMLRHAIGMPETPPNSVLIPMALMLTFFTMSPVLERVDAEALRPFMSGKYTPQQGADAAMTPLRDFMARQTRDQDLALVVELSKSPLPNSLSEVGHLQLIAAYMLSELRAAFQIGFVVFLPFLLIDLIVSSILMSLGMMMMPPVSVALPIKVLMFVLVDGWAVLVKALVGSFH